MWCRRSPVWWCNISHLHCSPSSRFWFGQQVRDLGARNAWIGKVAEQQGYRIPPATYETKCESELESSIAYASPNSSRKRRMLIIDGQLKKNGLPTFHSIPCLGRTRVRQRRRVQRY